MFYRIVEISTARASGHTYVLVHFWAAKADYEAAQPPALINDFLMQLRPTGQRIITNAMGHMKQKDTGDFVDPQTLLPKAKLEWARETFDRDTPAEIRANIVAYWARASARGDTGNKTNPRIQRDVSDPHGVLAKPEVAALRDSGGELP